MSNKWNFYQNKYFKILLTVKQKQEQIPLLQIGGRGICRRNWPNLRLCGDGVREERFTEGIKGIQLRLNDIKEAYFKKHNERLNSVAEECCSRHAQRNQGPPPQIQLNLACSTEGGKLLRRSCIVSHYCPIPLQVENDQAVCYMQNGFAAFLAANINLTVACLGCFCFS